MVCKVYRVRQEILVIREMLDHQDNRANRVRQALEVLPEGMVRQVLRVCWEALDHVVLPETMESMVQWDPPVHLVLLDLRVMELAMTLLLWRHCWATDKSAI